MDFKRQAIGFGISLALVIPCGLWGESVQTTNIKTQYGKKKNKTSGSLQDHQKKKNIYDFVVVGAGNAGCVIAKRLSENGKYSVCLLEAGRDDARLPELLPEPSSADVPQPGDFHWGQYVRATQLAGELTNRGFGQWWFYQTTNSRPNNVTSTSYKRYSGFGGCTSHNSGATLRNAPYNWNEWAALGLTEWSGGSAPLYLDSPLIKYYKKMENRSQALFGTAFKFYDPSLPPGSPGGFDPAYYGFDGMVPLNLDDSALAVTLLEIILTTPSLARFGYPPNLVDFDYPPTAALGGVGFQQVTNLFQIDDSTITIPGTAPAPGDFSNNVPVSLYNPYGDVGFKVPVEYQRLNDPTLDPSALFITQRSSAANTYLYAAQKTRNANLKIKSEVLVTNLIMSGKKAKGVEYLKGWNIYQTGRNPNTMDGGYGGTVADAKLNGITALEKGKKQVYARKAVILCAGVYNTPQILMLSGIGNKRDLKEVGIKPIHHLPGVGKHLIDAQELFIFWQSPTSLPPNSLGQLAAFTNPTDSPNGIPPTFDISISNILPAFDQNLESIDEFVQKSWIGLRSLPATLNANTRNAFENILLNPSNPTANPAPIPVTFVSKISPIPPETGPWLVTFSIPSSTVSQGGYTIAGNSNPNYDGKFTATNISGNNIPDVTSITLSYPLDPGIFGSGETTITGDPAFLPIMISPDQVLGILIEQEEHNRSEGYVKLQSSDPTVPPLIFMNYLSNPRDFRDWKSVMMNTVFPIMEQLPAFGLFSNLLWPAPADILKPGFTTFSVANVDDSPGGRLDQFLLNYVGGHHAMGTCKMGTSCDRKAVVDQHGAVHGIKHLYIADMSVVPVSVRWPNGTAYVIAEKIADDILTAYSSDKKNSKLEKRKK